MHCTRLTLVFVLLLVGTSSAASQTAAPTREEVTRAVHRLVDAGSDADSCAPPTTVGNELRYECTRRECPGDRQVVHVVTVLGYRAGRFRRVASRREPRGDTGECGCCL